MEGAHASVIGGAPAAAVVFAGEVAAGTRDDERVAILDDKAAAAEGNERIHLRAEAAALAAAVHAEELSMVAGEFDRVHSVERARDVGSITAIVPADRLRAYIVEAINRGVTKELVRTGTAR